jgi:hypothetical protein
VKSVKEAGLEIARVEIAPTGSIIIHAGKPEEEDSGNPWDKVLGNEDQDR